MTVKSWVLPLVALAVLITVPLQPSKAAWPVIDIASIRQLIQQVSYWKQQIAGMTNQLNQLKQTYASLTGTRGMQNILGLTPAMRNYLPPDWQTLMNVVKSSGGGYAGLSAKAREVLAANAVLTSTDLSRLSSAHRQLIEDGRNAAAMLEVMSQTAYGETSTRFTALQELIASIGSATDPKAIADLQGRIEAEQTMLQNEATKLESLRQSAEGAALAREQRVLEERVRGIGSINRLPTVTY